MASASASVAASEPSTGPEGAGFPEGSEEAKKSIWQKPVSNLEFYGIICCMLVIYVWGMLQPGPICRLGDPRKGCPPAATASRITVSSGRSIAYREWGVSKEAARHSILALHGTFECRHQALPGVSEDLLREFGVRMVSYDRPGTAQSDAMNAWSYLYHVDMDMTAVRQELDLAEPFWILAIDSGAPYAFHAAWRRPEWLAGIALLGPTGAIPGYPGMSESETKRVSASLPWPYYVPYVIASLPEVVASRLLPAYFQQFVVSSATSIPKALQQGCASRDLATLRDATVSRAMMERMAESLGQRNGRALAREYLLMSAPWHLNLSHFLTPDIHGHPPLHDEQIGDEAIAVCRNDDEGSRCARTHDRASLPIHIWHGTQDVHAPFLMTQHLQRTLGDRIQMHVLEGHGHFSYFYSCDECHRAILETLLGPPKGPLRGSSVKAVVEEEVKVHVSSSEEESKGQMSMEEGKGSTVPLVPDERARRCIMEGRACGFEGLDEEEGAEEKEEAIEEEAEEEEEEEMEEERGEF